MSVLTEMILRYAKSSSKQDVARFGLRLLGYDQETIEEATDEEVWRSTEEGKHFKFETSTGEIKAGFGGKFNGKKIGTTWGAGHAKAKPSGGSGSKSGGSRYWMHRLPEEKILGAAQTVRKAKEDMQFAQKQKDRLEMMWRKGYIPVSEMEERMKAQKLDKFSPDMTPEEFVMKCQPNDQKKALVDYAGEANSWNKKSEELLYEKLSPEELNAMATLSFNVNIKAGDTGNPADYARQNLDAAFNNLTEEEKEFYLDMKARACGLPDSGKKLGDYSDEFLVSVGVKEAPKEVPGQKKADYSWYQPARGNLEAFMSEVTGDKVSYGRQYTREEFEQLNQRFVDSIAYEKLSPNKLTYYGTSVISNMRQRMGLYGQNKPTDQMTARLSDDDKRHILDVVNRYKDPNSFLPEDIKSFDQLTFEDMEKAERNICRLNMNRFRSEESRKPFKDYILMQEKMLTGAVPESEEIRAEKEKAKAEAAKAEERAKTARRKQEQADFRTSEQAKAKAEKIKKIKVLDTDALRSDQYDRFDVERAANDAGFFTDEKYFVTDSSIPKEVYCDAVDAYKNVVNRFPFLAGELMGFGDAYSVRSANAACKKVPGDSTEIMINFKALRNVSEYRNNRARSESAKWHVPVIDSVSAAQATISHELGHATANWLHRAVYGDFKETKVRNDTYYDNEVATLLKDRTMDALGLKPTYENIKNEVSEYAAASRSNKASKGQCVSNTKADEFFAECFCELVCSKHPRRAAVEFGRQLDRFIRENGIDDMTTAQTTSTRPAFV